MLRQFASASVVAGIAVACGALVVLMVPGFGIQRSTPLLAVWCVAPLIWGLWAAVAPASWIPQRLPLWGAILGLAAGLLATFVLNMPLRVLGVALPVPERSLLALAMAAFYYVLWMLVRKVHKALGGPAAESRPTTIYTRAA
ncbi:MAG TPA: hypothetical protein VL523_07355 [Terriglobia bacterium]|nr:hypothetical protein [Terriglobia bacterium]